jgi:conjugative transfer signal peptidase TraF
LSAGAVIASAAALAGRLTWNVTASLPRGLYAIDRGVGPARGDTVVFKVPVSVADLVLARRYLPDGAQLLKRVVAVAGDDVCLDGRLYAVDGQAIAAVRAEDSLGRPLPRYRFCGVVGSGEVYVATEAPRSFDSRYFGPVRVSDLTVVKPLWTY